MRYEQKGRKRKTPRNITLILSKQEKYNQIPRRFLHRFLALSLFLAYNQNRAHNFAFKPFKSH